MFNSVRVRLTLWHVGAVACVLLILAGATLLLLQRNSLRRVDNSLEDVANAFLATVRAELHDPDSSGHFKDSIATAIQEHTYRETSFSVFDSAGSLVLSSNTHPAFLDSELPRFDQLRTQAVANPPARHPFRTMPASGHLYRGYARSFSVEGKNYVLVVLQSMHGEHEFLEAVTQTYALLIPLAVLLAGLGGYFLARRSLSPVVAMSSQAGRIGAENLHDRLVVRNTKDELGHLARSFNELLDRLDESFEHQRRFVADASHELRTPVAILSGEAEVALSRPDRAPEEYRESLEILRKEAIRLRQIVENLFTLTRADIGQYPLTLASFYWDEPAAYAFPHSRALAQAKHITPQCENASELIINADKSLLRRMSVNL